MVRKVTIIKEKRSYRGGMGMAMIKCPECGQEISDKAKKCIHCGKEFVEEKPKTKICSECGKENSLDATECAFCGCPLEDISGKEDFFGANNQNSVKNKKSVVKIIVPIVAVALVAIIGIVFYNVKVVKPKNTYDEAMEILEKGKYNEADELLKSIEGYKDVSEIREKLKYESCAYSAVNAVKEILKNPDSISVYDVKFYSGLKDSQNDSKNDKDDKEDSENSTEENDIIIDEDHPCVILHIGAQNGFGGNTESYALCSYNKKEDKYQLQFFTKELDKDKLDEDDDDYFYEAVSAILINEYIDNGIEVGSVDMNRFKTVLKNDAYSTIKVIE